MTTIRCVYSEEPGFPATDQHPDAVRYQVGAYWVDAIGGEPTEAEVLALLAPSAPTVTPRQIRLALTAGGLRDAVEAYVAAAPQGVKDSWEYSAVFERNHPLLVEAGAALGKTEAEIDALFDLAASL